MTDHAADELALRELAARYAIAADEGDGDGYATIFLPGGHLVVFRPDDTDTPSTDLTGHDRLAAVPRLLAERFDRTFHLIGQSIYAIGTDEATGVIYCMAHHLTVNRDGATDHVMHMRYRDDYRRDGHGVWKIAERIAHVDWTETRPADAPNPVRSP